LLASLAPSVAHAGPFDDPYDLPSAPRPPTLPELTHPDLEATIESTVGTLTPRQGRTPSPDCDACTSRFAFVQRLAIEIPLGPRRWFIGTTYELAGGGHSDQGGIKMIGGNLELYGRTVWATQTGLAFGGGLGVVLPTSSFDPSSQAGSVALSAATLRPWDLPFFTNDVVVVRPFVDVRDIVGRTVIHFRQGLDVFTDVTNVSSRRITAMTALYIGYRVFSLMSLGIEAMELYTLDGSGDDGLRATFVVSPSVRVMTPYVQPALSGFTNVGPPLYGNADHIWGVRLAVTVVYDATTRQIERGTPEHGRAPE
jgi:hypothetical protein